MKKVIRTVMVMSILLVGLMTYAENGDPKPAMVVKTVNTENFVLFVEEVQSEALLVIKDAYGFVIYYEVMARGKGFRKIYNISNFPSGTYYIQVLDNENSWVYSMVKAYKILLVKVDFTSQKNDAKLFAIL
jgi:hypothetical protein